MREIRGTHCVCSYNTHNLHLIFFVDGQTDILRGTVISLALMFFAFPLRHRSSISLNCRDWQHSIGGSYFGYPWRTQAVQRLKQQTHVGTLASRGACSQGEIGLQCEILGLLQQGCLGLCKVTGEEGGMLEQEVR